MLTNLQKAIFSTTTEVSSLENFDDLSESEIKAIKELMVCLIDLLTEVSLKQVSIEYITKGDNNG